MVCLAALAVGCDGQRQAGRSVDGNESEVGLAALAAGGDQAGIRTTGTRMKGGWQRCVRWPRYAGQDTAEYGVRRVDWRQSESLTGYC